MSAEASGKGLRGPRVSQPGLKKNTHNGKRPQKELFGQVKVI
jgi:hypothetical protein